MGTAVFVCYLGDVWADYPLGGSSNITYLALQVWTTTQNMKIKKWINKKQPLESLDTTLKLCDLSSLRLDSDSNKSCISHCETVNVNI